MNIQEKKEQGIKTIKSIWGNSIVYCQLTPDKTLLYNVRFPNNNISIYIENWFEETEAKFISNIFIGKKEIVGITAETLDEILILIQDNI